MEGYDIISLLGLSFTQVSESVGKKDGGRELKDGFGCLRLRFRV